MAKVRKKISKSKSTSLSPSDALKKLKDGNQRFVKNIRGIDAYLTQANRKILANRPQSPSVIILSCSDSRVPAELIFDQGLGELFVVRVAGNVVAPSIVGSIEFAAATFGTPLVVVMGHTQCGAITATLNFITEGKHGGSENIHDIIHRIEPHIRLLTSRNKKKKRSELMNLSVRAHIEASVDHLKHGSRVLEELHLAGKLEVLGALYDLKTGKVNFFEKK